MNVQDAFTAVSLPPLGQSDHNLIQLIPKYRPLVQREPIVTRAIKEWSTYAVENYKGSLDCTDWDVFVDSASDIKELTESVCGYVEFCVERAMPQKTVKMFPNNKPWITKRIKSIISRKTLAFQKTDKEKSVQKGLKEKIRKEKEQY